MPIKRLIKHFADDPRAGRFNLDLSRSLPYKFLRTFTYRKDVVVCHDDDAAVAVDGVIEEEEVVVHTKS